MRHQNQDSWSGYGQTICSFSIRFILRPFLFPERDNSSRVISCVNSKIVHRSFQVVAAHFNSWLLLMTSCLCEKRYQALPVYLRSEAGRPGNKARSIKTFRGTFGPHRLLPKRMGLPNLWAIEYSYLKNLLLSIKIILNEGRLELACRIFSVHLFACFFFCNQQV